LPEILQKRTEQPRRVLILERNITGMDLMRARQRLEEERAHRQALAQRLRQEEADPPESTELSKVDQHPAELGSETFDRELELTTLTITEAELKDIDDALRRLDAGTYGICEACGNPIEEERLAAKPWARFCIVDQAREELALSRR
jgi:RNA polymerase-binding transcription factor DksA